MYLVLLRKRRHLNSATRSKRLSCRVLRNLVKSKSGIAFERNRNVSEMSRTVGRRRLIIDTNGRVDIYSFIRVDFERAVFYKPFDGHNVNIKTSIYFYDIFRYRLDFDRNDIQSMMEKRINPSRYRYINLHMTIYRTSSTMKGRFLRRDVFKIGVVENNE